MARKAEQILIISAEHVKRRALCCHRGQLFSGVIEELSPSGGYFRVGGRWLENKAASIRELLPDEKQPAEKPGRYVPD